MSGIVPDAAIIMAGLLGSVLMLGNNAGRRDLTEPERSALRWLAHRLKEFPDLQINAWTGDRVRAFDNGQPILPGWHTESTR